MKRFKGIRISQTLMLTFFACYPFLITAVLGWLIMPYLKGYLKEIIAFGLLTFALYGFVILMSRKTFWNYLFLICYWLLALLSFIKLSFYHHYNVKISASALFVIFETNAPEASVFMASYIDVVTISIFIILFLPFLFFIRPLLKKRYTLSYRVSIFRIKPIFIKVIALLLVLFSFYIIHKKFWRENIVVMSVIAYEEYKSTKQNLKENLAQPESKSLHITSSLEEPQTYVVIIGESTSRWHMQLYGYERETNPLLTQIKDDLLVFDSVITPHVHTILALEKIFTLSNHDNSEKQDSGSLVQMANQAGFETYWISNQKPVGFHESIATIIGNAANHKYFLTTEDYPYDIYDENVLPVLKDILAEDQKKKFIFLHLIGTHDDYLQRYPKDFDYFEGESDATKFKHIKAKYIVNHYDNAIRYNDYIINEIIKQVKSKNTKSYVAYFSDHGDEVYDTINFKGHSEDIATRPMYEIPFIVWLSESYKEARPEFLSIKGLVERRYNFEDFIHSFSDLSNIKFAEMDSSRSIFSKYYKRRTRFIKKGEIYDDKP